MSFRQHKAKIIAAVLLVGCLSSGATQAASIGLDADASAIAGFFGLANFQTTAPGPFTANGDVDVYFAVYAPGTDYNNTVLGSAPAGVDTANEYVYVYQMFNKTTPFGAADGSITQLSVGMTDWLGSTLLRNGNSVADGVNEFEDRGVIDYINNGDQLPNDQGFTPDVSDLVNTPSAAVWDFDNTFSIPTGEWSAPLYYSSEDAPEYDTVNVSGAFWGNINTIAGDEYVAVPSPAPEPSSLVLIALAGATCLARRVRRNDA